MEKSKTSPNPIPKTVKSDVSKLGQGAHSEDEVADSEYLVPFIDSQMEQRGPV